MAILFSDLTVETAEQLSLTGKKARRLNGVDIKEKWQQGYAVTSISIRSNEAGRALGKPPGHYITVELQPYFQRQTGFFSRGVACLRRELLSLLPHLTSKSTILVVGLGNRNLICDAVGPKAIESLLVTRHLDTTRFSFVPVAAIAAGVVGQTGVETGELVQSLVRAISPAAVLVIDALCAHTRRRLCATIQLSDTGLIPGSGVDNHRTAINHETLGVPVVALGIPTVIAGSTLARELTGETAQEKDGLFLTPQDVDSRVTELSRLLGYAITAALQPELTMEDITALLG